MNNTSLIFFCSADDTWWSGPDWGGGWDIVWGCPSGFLTYSAFTGRTFRILPICLEDRRLKDDIISSRVNTAPILLLLMHHFVQQIIWQTWLNFLCPDVEQIDGRFRSKEAHAVTGGREAAPRLRGRGEAGQPRVMAAEAGMMSWPRAQARAGWEEFLTAVNVRVRVTLLLVKPPETVDVLLLLPSQDHQFFLQKLDCLEELNRDIGDNGRGYLNMEELKFNKR